MCQQTHGLNIRFEQTLNEDRIKISSSTEENWNMKLHSSQRMKRHLIKIQNIIMHFKL